MIDLEMLARTFVGPAIEITQANVQKKMDDPAIQAVHNKEQPDRENALKRWLESYSALQGFTTEDRRRVVAGMLGFADTHGCHFARLSFEELIEKYDQLRGICGKAVALTKADRERDLVSLTSKGLWCCYPNGVPMFDRYVQSALWILCKLSQLCPKKSTASNGRYAGFADVWFQVYNQVEHIIAESGSDWLFLQGARFRSNAMGHRTTQLRSGYYRDQKIILTESKGTCGKRPESFTRRLRIARPRGRSLQRGSGDRDC